jgi:hypothetical protein
VIRLELVILLVLVKMREDDVSRSALFAVNIKRVRPTNRQTDEAPQSRIKAGKVTNRERGDLDNFHG